MYGAVVSITVAPKRSPTSGLTEESSNGIITGTFFYRVHWMMRHMEATAIMIHMKKAVMGRIIIMAALKVPV